MSVLFRQHLQHPQYFRPSQLMNFHIARALLTLGRFHISRTLSLRGFAVPIIQFTLLLLICSPYPSAAMGTHEGGEYKAGLQILALWEEGTNERIPVYVWYPSVRPEQSAFLEPYTISAAREGKPEEGKFPVILISHATAESGLSHHTTEQYLARKGFIVVAPTHPGDNIFDTSRLLTERQIIDRPRHLVMALDAMLAHPEIGPLADQTKIGMIGYGVGATAALLLTGAQPNTIGLRNYCTAAQENDPYCSLWAQKRLAPMLVNPKGVMSPPAGTTWYDKRIRSIALIAPAYGMLFDASSFANFKTSAMLLEAENDVMNVPAFHAQHLRSLLSDKTPYFILVGATNYTLHSPCNERMSANFPTICKDPQGTDRKSILTTLNDILLRFFTSRMIDN